MVALGVRKYPAALEDLRAQLLGGPGQAQGIIEGMQVAGAHVQCSAVETFPGSQLRQFVPINKTDVLIVVDRPQMVYFFPQSANLLGLGGGMQVALL